MRLACVRPYKGGSGKSQYIECALIDIININMSGGTYFGSRGVSLIVALVSNGGFRKDIDWFL